MGLPAATTLIGWLAAQDNPDRLLSRHAAPRRQPKKAGQQPLAEPPMCGAPAAAPNLHHRCHQE